MNKNASRQSLQAMISRAIDGSMSKTAADKGSTDKKVKDLVSYEMKEHGHIPTPSEEAAECEKTASVDSDFVTKLASAVEWIAGNLDKIEFPQQGVLSKMAEEAGSPAGPGKGPGALEVEKSMDGQQAYKKDHPKTEDAAKSQANSPMSTAGLPGSKTQMENNMHDAPGGGSVKPTGSYPDKGPLVAGPSVKHAADYGEKEKEEHKRIARGSGRVMGGLGAIQGGVGGGMQAGVPGALAGALLGGSMGYGLGYGSNRLSNYIGRHLGGEGVEAGPLKLASPLAAAIMRKLAGEDVMKANIDGGGTTSPLAGMGQLTSTDASQSSPSQAGDPVSGHGNQGRRLIQSNQAAIDASKRDAKGPIKTQLKEVLDEPALSPSTDSTLEENLRNTGKAGVKIAGARAYLEKVAAAGCTCAVSNGECPSCRLTAKLAAVAKGKGSEKRANAMMGMGGGGGGAMPPSPSPSMMSSMADAGAGADGCTCAGAGECKVCKLKAALAAVKAQSPIGGPEGVPVEKDSTMGMGAAPAGGIY